MRQLLTGFEEDLGKWLPLPNAGPVRICAAPALAVAFSSLAQGASLPEGCFGAALAAASGVEAAGQFWADSPP